MTAFTHYLRVRYSECDAQAVVFNATYAEYVDIAATEYMRAIWGDYNNVLAQGVDNQVVSLKIDWRSPARFDEVVAIEVETTHIGNTSFTLALKFHQPLDNREIAVAEITYVMVSVDEHRKMAIPDDLREALKGGAVGKFSNHAGIEI